MQRAMKSAVIGLLMLVSTAVQARAEQIFDFTFTGDSGNVSGTVSGEIVLPFSGDGTGAASSVVIDSYPAGFPISGDFTVAPWTGSDQAFNTFTVTGGEITYAYFIVVGSPTADTQLYLQLEPPGNEAALTALINLPSYDPVDLFSSAGATYTPASVPEPATLTLFGMGFLTAGGFGLVRRRRQRAKSSPAC